jgi:murein DD-endopeptidase MepM/ murein hydrolase activator NlpD
MLEKAEAAVDSLITIKKELNNTYQVFLNADAVVLDLQEKLEPVRLKINSLEEQLATLDENMRRTEINIDVLKEETKSVIFEIADLQDLMDLREVELAQTEKLLAEFIRLAYAESSRYTDWQTGEISTLKFLLAEGTLADAETNQTYLAVLQGTSSELIQNLQTVRAGYEKTRAKLLQRRGRLALLQKDLLNEKQRLDEMRAAKAHLLEITKGEERQYQQLIQENQKQQEEALKQIAELKDNMAVINEKLQSLGKELGQDKLMEILKKQGIAGTNGLTFPGHTPRLAWPADPSRGLTAYFHDQEYKNIFGVPHNAIDFRLPQGSLVTAAAPGVVFRAKDNGYGYSYVMLAHSGGISTVYGHISKILVKQGDLVQAGDTIGLSGGSPGTPGAGFMTTGPHLHFEVINDGKHQNPLDYLPLEQLRKEDIPAEYLKEAEQTI